MASAMCGVFDEKFLSNFSLPSGPFSVSDMMLVDRILRDEGTVVRGNMSDGPVSDGCDASTVDMRVEAAEHSSSSVAADHSFSPVAAEHSSSPVEVEHSFSPEATRYQGGNDEDMLDMCSQRRRSTFCVNNKLISAHQKDSESEIGFYELSPIMKGLDNTLFGSDQRCELGTTFDTFGSPTWLNQDDRNDSEDLLQEFNLATDNEIGSSSRLATDIADCIHDTSADQLHPHLDNPDLCELDMFTRLSINGNNVRDTNIDQEPLPNNQRKAKKQLGKHLRKGPRMKQTTVTFFYDSDEEIRECSEGDSQEQFDYSNHQKSCKFGFRNALGLTKKYGGQLSDRTDRDGSKYNGRSAASSSSCVESCSVTAHNDESSRNNHHHTVHNADVFVHAGLQSWIKLGPQRGRFESIVVCCEESRKSAIKTMIESSISPSTDPEKQSTNRPKNPPKRVSKKSPLIPSEGLLIVTVKSRMEDWAKHIRNLPEPRLLLYSDTLAKRRKCGAHNVAQYDVVITTFEILRAKEVCIPEEESSNSESEEISGHYDCRGKENRGENRKENIKENIGEDINMSDDNSNIKSNCSELRSEQLRSEHSPCKSRHRIAKVTSIGDPMGKKNIKNVPWIANRKNGVLLERSNIHLIHWRDIIMDFHHVTNIRTDTARGVAARGLTGGSKQGLILSVPMGGKGTKGGKKWGRIDEEREENEVREEREEREEKEEREENKGEENGYEGFDSDCSTVDSGTDRSHIDTPSPSSSPSSSSPSFTAALRGHSLVQQQPSAIGTIIHIEKPNNPSSNSSNMKVCGKIVDSVRGVLRVPPGVRDREVLFDMRK